MQFDFLSASPDWWTALRRLPANFSDMYFTPEYHHLHAANGDGTAECTAIIDGEQTLIVPGLRVPIPAADASVCSDLQTCNGYGGPLASPNASREFIEQAWAEWQRQRAAAGVVAGFFRLHPLLANERCLPAAARVIWQVLNQWVDTDGTKKIPLCHPPVVR